MTYSDSDSPLSSPPESADEAPPVPRHVTVKPAATTKRQKATAAATAATATKNKKKRAPPAPAPPPTTTITKIKLKAPAPSPSPPPKRRRKEPPHVYTLADSPELAFIVMFRSRFSDAFKGVPNLGCQDIERGIVDSTPSEQVEQLLCRLVGLVLNRKKPVERGHHNRALEEAVHAHQAHWPRQWEGRNPMPGGKSFRDLDTAGRLVLLKALINWALISSEQIRGIISDNYKGARREDDLNVAISVQPWGRDGDRRRYWLIEGKDDTPFRLYRESNPQHKNTWINIAGTLDEIRNMAKELEEDDGTKHALDLKTKIESAILRFEDGEKKRQKREYRATRKAMFSQPSGISLYEGRTRGKKVRYTYSDNEHEDQDKESSHSSTTRSRHSPITAPNPDQPRFTASGRQIRRPQTGAYGESKINGSAGVNTGSNAPSENGYAYTQEAVVDEWKGDSQGDDDDEDDGGHNHGDDEEDADDESEWDDTAFLQQDAEKKSLRIVLKVNHERLSRKGSIHEGGGGEDVPMKDVETLANGHSPPIAKELNGA